MSDPIVSIIVPVYNAEKYLKQCLRSIVSQTYADIEVILVNDGSTDRSLEICEKAAKKDPRVIVISKQNEGCCMARHTGIAHSKGQFILFCDADDLLEARTAEIAVSRANQSGADIVVFSMFKKIGPFKLKKSKTRNRSCFAEERVYDHREFMQTFFRSFFGITNFPVTLWGKLYRKDLFDRAKPEAKPIFFGEDLIMNIQLLPFAEKIHIIPHALYCYRAGGGTTKFNARFLEDYSVVKKHQIESVSLAEEKKEEFLWSCHVETVNILFTFCGMIIKFLKKNRQETLLMLEGYFNQYAFFTEAHRFFSENAAKLTGAKKLWCFDRIERYMAKDFESIYDMAVCFEKKQKWLCLQRIFRVFFK
ncbi:MAG: glycosyltransferase [Oscillospiraceae bacterium]|nr:glycosyltransferase [Oscillospiraceae bacterium]